MHCARREFPRRLHGRQQQGYKDADNGNDHQEFHEREAVAAKSSPRAVGSQPRLGAFDTSQCLNLPQTNLQGSI